MLGIEVLSDGTIIYSTWLVALFLILIFWELIWKGLALYRAGKKQQPVWFVIILILNTIGILPIAYLIISKDKKRTKKK